MPNDIISKIKVGTVTYDINDSRVDSIADKIDSLSSAMILKGRSKQVLTDGGTQDPTKTSGTTMDNDAGDVWLQYGDEHQEYVWIVTDTSTSPAMGHWELLGDEGSYVYKTYTHTFTPSGTVSTPNFTGTTANITATTSYQPAGTISQPTATAQQITLNHTVLISEDDPGNYNYQPKGTISAPSVTTKTFTGTTTTLSIAASYQPEGTVSKPTFTGTTATLTSTASYQPEGTVSQPSFTGTTATITVKTNEAVTAVDDHTYQPEGTISTPSLSFSTTTFTSSNITVNNEVLSLPTVCLTGPSGSISYASGISAPTFTGTTATLSHSLTKATVTSTGSYQPAGSVSQPTFTGTTATIGSDIEYQPAGTINVVVASPTFTGNVVEIGLQAHTFTPQVTVATPSFTGTTATITSTASYQPAGTISQPTFTGNTVTLTHDAI